MCRPDAQVQIIDQSCHQWQLFGWSDRPADSNGIIWCGLFPGGDVLERFGEVKILESVIKHDPEAWARQPEHCLRRQRRGVAEEIALKRRVIPPIRGDGAELAGHGHVSGTANLP